MENAGKIEIKPYASGSQTFNRLHHLLALLPGVDYRITALLIYRTQPILLATPINSETTINFQAEPALLLSDAARHPHNQPNRSFATCVRVRDFEEHLALD
ncbi:hypothetical protein RRG08_000504 [Elysia crispata]|uniref:Uncharacterized protein n=1 Tax=Elysia crispata TaxID=231223 RepID=A0AAE0YCJ1_9GAST|nr:hypothetical protein RRG08_000504 [Elysia crispata]